MPFIRIETNIDYDIANIKSLLKESTDLISKFVNKPAVYIMGRVAPCAPMSFGGEDVPSAYVEMKSVGLSDEQAANLSPELTRLIVSYLNVPAENVYIEFTNAKASFWGCGGPVLG
jgi:phenylpyruvate tautomerase